MIRHSGIMIRAAGIALICCIVLALPLLLVTDAAEPDAKALYESKCALCHGKDCKAQTKGGQMMKTPDLTTADWKNGNRVEDIEKTLHEGLGTKMKSYEGKLTPAEISAVAKYAAELCKKSE